MNLLDVILLLALFGFAWFGFWFGMIHAAGGLVGSLAGAWLAGHLYQGAAAWIAVAFQVDEPSAWLRLATFAAIFIVVNRLIGFAFYVVDRTFSFLVRIPFLRTIDRMAGAILGLLEGGLVLGLTLYFATRLDLPRWFEQMINGSEFADPLIVFAGLLVPLLPELIRRVQPYVPVDIMVP